MENRLSRFPQWLRQHTARNIAIALTIAALISGVATYNIITQNSGALAVDSEMVLLLILVDLVLLLGLGVVISYKITKLWLARRRGSVGSRLQTRIVALLSLVAILPTIAVAIFSALFFYAGVQAWFNERVGTALNESVAVAESYLAEHKEIIRTDALAMAYNLSRQAPELISNSKRFDTFVSNYAALRSLTEAVVFQRGNILGKTPLSFSLIFDVESLTDDVLARAGEGEVVLLTSDTENRVRALIKLNNFFDTYLLVGRPVDSKVLAHVEQTKGSAAEYQRLKNNISGLQIKFSILFIGVALLLLLATIWVGMVFAAELVKPVNELVSATERVKAGDLQARVTERPHNDEIGTLGRAFNRMTDQLEKQRAELIEVNRQIDTRRHFIEAVLSGVSAGVIALDSHKHITLANRSAINLLHTTSEALQQQLFSDVFPEMKTLIKQAEKTPEKAIQDEIHLTRNNRKMTLLVRIVAEELGHAINGYIVTFDDITELQAAQRSAAWADVARRIAHEIKNPLTPIHLAAERLKRKYRKDVKDASTYDRYIDTIIRHVGDIGNMVEEFVSFARMPAPEFANIDLAALVQDAVFSQKVAHAGITFTTHIPEHPIHINGDERQITQLLTNLLKNAAEAISEHATSASKGHITLTLQEEKEHYTLEIADNGPGFPPELLDQLTEPYVTTREKGTGLGLAIVKKVTDDHDARLLLHNITDKKGTINGACVTLSFPLSTQQSATLSTEQSKRNAS